MFERSLALAFAALLAAFACARPAPPASEAAPNRAPAEAPADLGDAGLALALVDALNDGRLADAAAAFAPDAEWTVPADPGLTVRGRDALMARWRTERAAFPDLRLAVRRVLDGDGVVVLQTVARGTHQGPYLGRPATHRPVGYELLHVLTFARGHVQRVATYGHPRAVEAQIDASGPATALPEWPDAPEVVAGRGRADHLASVVALYQGMEDGDPDVIDALCAPSVVGLDRADGTRIEGAAQTKRWLTALHQTFGPLDLDTGELVAIGPYVVAPFVVTGRHGAALGELAPSGRPVAFHGADVVRFGPGGITHVEAYIDRAQLTRQLAP